MESMTINRRRFVRFTLTLGAGAALSSWQWLRRRPKAAAFYVAGVRFNRVAIPPRLNERVVIQEEQWRGLSSYAVLTQQGERIGYVPREAIPMVTETAAAKDRWCLCAANRFALPWKRYRVSIRS